MTRVDVDIATRRLQRQLEAAERKLATYHADLSELKVAANSIYCTQEKSTLTVAKDLLELIAAFVTGALDQIDQPQSTGGKQ